MLDKDGDKYNLITAGHSGDVRFRTLIELNADAIIIIGKDGVIRFINPAGETLLGRTGAQLIGAAFGFPLNPDTPSELDILQPQGQLRVAEMRVVELEWEGEPVYLASLRDVTGRKLSEQREINQRKFLETLLETIPSPVFYKDLEGRYLGCNQAFEELLGRTREQIIGSTAYDLAPRVMADKYHQADLELFRKQTGQVYEYRVHANDGAVRDVIFNKAPYYDESGTLAGLIGVISDITGHRQAEIALRESEEKHRTLFETMTQGVFYQDREGVITHANTAAERILGIPVERMIGRVGSDVVRHAIHEDGSEYERDAFPSIVALRTGEEVRNAVMGAPLSGERNYTWLNVTAVPQFRPGSPEPHGVYTAFEIITERKRAEDAVKLNEARLQSLVHILQHQFDNTEELLEHALNEALKLTGSEFGYIYHYHEDRKVFELSSWSKSVMEKCHVVEKQTVYRLDLTGIWGDAVRGRKPIVVNNFQDFHPLKKGYPEGHAEIFKFLTVPIFSYGKIVAVIGVANKQADYDQTDMLQLMLLMDSVWRIVERKRAEESLRWSEEKYRTLVENVPGAVFRHEVDAPWRAGFVSEGIQAITGRPAAHFQEGTVTFSDIVAPEDLPGLIDAVRDGVTRKRPFEVEYRIVHHDGSVRWVHKIGQCTYGWDGKPVHIDGILIDITARKEVDNQLLEAKRAAEAAVHAKSEFLANMSHEIRTPITAVLGMVDMALSMQLDVQVRKCLLTVRDAATSLLHIINDILDLSKIDAGMLDLDEEVFDPGALLRAVVETYGVAAGQKGIRLSCAVSPAVPENVVGDSDRLRQVLANLVSNSVKFTETGEILIAVGRNPKEGADGRDLEKRGGSPGSPALELLFSVRDTGIGIARGLHERLFESFTQADASTSKKYGGTGLGLAICKRLVGMMGGGIWFESEEGRGTTFYFTIRCRHAVHGATERKEASGPADTVASTPRGLRILLAEDNEMNRTFLVHFVQRKGHEIVTAANGQEVLEVLKKTKPFDLILMDVQMPELDGLDTTRIIRSGELEGVDPTIPIIALTAYAMKGDSERFLEAGMNAYVAKPVNVENLFSSMEMVLGGKGKTTEMPATAAGGREAIPPVDVEALKSDCLVIPKLEDFFREAIDVFLRETPDRMDELGAALDHEEMDRAARLAHRMVSSSGTLKAVGVVHLARKIEEAARTNEAAKARDYFASLQETMRKALEILADVSSSGLR